MSLTSENTSKPQALYRFYDADGELLYIGITSNPGARWKRHAGDKPWWTEVASTTIEHFGTREDVEVAERSAIRAERPKYNRQHNSSNGSTRGSRSARAVDRLRPAIERIIGNEIDEEILAESISMLCGYVAASYDSVGESSIADLEKQFGCATPDRLSKLLAWSLLRLADAHSDYSTDARPEGLYPQS